VDDYGAWVIEARLRVHQNESGWRGRPVVVFDAESGSGSRVKWSELEGVTNCAVDGDYLVIPAGARDVRFRGVTDPASHPVPAISSAVSVDFRNVEEQAA
jgi:RNA polymerase primary sigma factor